MKILISNDDGIQAEGLRCLAARLMEKHDVYVCAPDRQRSGCSHAVTYFLKDLTAVREEFPGAKGAWSLDGMPADCVYCAVNGLMDAVPDLVISGINEGPNYSTDCVYSGTVGAASEGIVLGIPSIAVSLAGASFGYEYSAKITEILMERYINDPSAKNYVLNINIPELREEEIRGIKVTRFDRMRNYGRRLDVTEENGKIRLHCPQMTVPVDTDDSLDDGDVRAVEEGYVSVTPLDTDLVLHSQIELLHWVK
ncbi:MAG: 5'/3'-nucleotidase SurE [Solobacterium sp.]|nr:5'/3'-nucleotidase SurE [Solobacterium sp.]